MLLLLFIYIWLHHTPAFQAQIASLQWHFADAAQPDSSQHSASLVARTRGTGGETHAGRSAWQQVTTAADSDH